MKQCPVAKKCGGCQLQNLNYDEQLSLKQSKIIRMAGKYCHVDEIIGMENPYRYRNKATHIFGFKSGKIVSGIYQSSARRIIPVDDCFLEDEYSNKIVQTVKKLCVSFKLKAYDLNTKRGFVRHVLVRRGSNNGEIMVVIVTAKDDFPKKRDFVSALIEKHPDITTVVWNINPTDTPVFLGQKSEVLYGDGYITDTLCGLKFRISPNSFYQVNPIQTEILYNKVKEFATLNGNERVIDAYCGTGTIGLTLAKNAKEVIGVEVNADSVNDARFNAEMNGIKNAKYICADAGEFMVETAQKGEKIDVVITDPPRSGCSKKFLDSLLTLNPERIVYVSCNPETLSRDLFVLRKGGYRVNKIQPVDMFPHTEHVETIVCLNKQ
ncbi:MAG: 23S rRNA (uracil(1939)-C(5))-methyltransferase RlmD [Clostridia bacterium]|nr:23S rRNA (uracil(1939)-C(5))-methyltransferase RlmD [Clostridia bacterium]